MDVPIDVTIAIVESELRAAKAYAARHGWQLGWNKEELIVFADGKHPADQTPVRWQADITSYRALPPIWACFQGAGSDGATIWKPRSPKPETLPGGVGSIFHSSCVVCAPFNRLAYKEHGGPHSGDWGGSANWLQIRGRVRAINLAEMLAQIIVHLNYSKGWQ